MKRPPRIFTEGDKRYILINGKKYYLKTKSNDKKLVSIVINNIMNKVKRRKRKGILQKKPTKLESSSSSSSSSTTSNTYNNNTLTYANSYNKYQQLITDMKVEEARNELNKQKQINKAFQPTSQQLAITGVPPAPPLPGTNYTPQLTHIAGKLLTIENRLQNQATLTDLANISRQLNTLQSDINNINKASKNITVDLQERDKLNREVEELKKLIPRLTKAAEDEKERIKKEEEAEKERIKQEAERIKKENEKKIKQMESDFKENRSKILKKQIKGNFDEDYDFSAKEKGTIHYPFKNSLGTEFYAIYSYDSNGNIYRVEEKYNTGNIIPNLKKQYNLTELKNDPYNEVKLIAKKEIQAELEKNKLKLDDSKQEEITTVEPKQPEFSPLTDKTELKVPDAPKKPDQPPEQTPEQTPEKPKSKTKKKGNKGHEEAEGDGLYDYELDDIMKGYKKYGYLGCFTLDEIKKINPENKKRISFFLNHDEHWMAVYLDASKDLSLEFMDPFGKNPPTGFKEAMNNVINKMAPKLYLKYKINQIPQQNIRSDNCGAIAARFLMDRYANKSFKEATNYTIEKSEKKAEGLRAKYGYGAPKFGFI